MRVRGLLVMVFVAYVALDLGCPLVPGAFRFDAAASVDGVSSYRERPPALPGPAVLPATPVIRPAVRHSVPAAVVVHAGGGPVAGRPHAGRDRLPAPEPSRAVDDD